MKTLYNSPITIMPEVKTVKTEQIINNTLDKYNDYMLLYSMFGDEFYFKKAVETKANFIYN